MFVFKHILLQLMATEYGLNNFEQINYILT